MNEFIKELRRRHVPRFAVIYIVTAWLALQVATTLLEAGIVPQIVATIVFYGSLIAFPFALVFAWVFDIDLKKGLIPTSGFEQAGTGDEVRANQPRIPPAKSIAVLPFADRSVGGDQGFLSDGIAEEILNALVKVEGLRVAGRTSSFALNGKDFDLPTICKMLNVAHVLEGSVRKQGDRIRVTTQLIKAEDGFHQWSETFDGCMDDIFDFEDQISLAVASELEVVLSEKKDDHLVVKCTDNSDAYTLFLQGKALFAQRIGDNLPKAIALFEEAVAKDPLFARAWTAMARAQVLLPTYVRGVDRYESMNQAEQTARKALSLNPKSDGAHAVLGSVNLERRNYVEMQREYKTALALSPEDMTTPQWYAQSLLTVGRIEKAEKVLKRIVDVDPVAILAVHFLSLAQWIRGDMEGSELNGTQALKMGFLGANLQLAEIAAARGDADRAGLLTADAILGLATDFSDEERALLGRGVFGNAKDRVRALEFVDSYMSSDGPQAEPFIPYFLVRIGEPERAIKLFRTAKASVEALFFYGVWGPHSAKTRQHPEFRKLVEEIGMVDYWREYSWPDSSTVSPDGDFTFA